MLIIQDVLVSDDLVQEKFVCDLSACKGACCWEGDLGAPLKTEELAILDRIAEQVKPFLSPAGLAVLAQEGHYTFYDDTQDFGTPLIDGGPCAYMTYNALGMAKCGIEEAFNAGVIDFKKPVSCHLYPVRVVRNEEAGYEALNYDQWDICSAACTLGEREKVPVYQFVKDALVREYGEAFFEELDAAAQYMAQESGDR